MMSDMLERVARAIFDNVCLANPHIMTTWETLSWDLQSFYSENARAAIEAMREPSDEMKAAIGVYYGHDIANWQRMIDAALS